MNGWFMIKLLSAFIISGIENSFGNKKVRQNFYQKYYQILLHRKFPKKETKLMLVGPPDSGKSSWFCPFKGEFFLFFFSFFVFVLWLSELIKILGCILNVLGVFIKQNSFLKESSLRDLSQISFLTDASRLRILLRIRKLSWWTNGPLIRYLVKMLNVFSKVIENVFLIFFSLNLFNFNFMMHLKLFHF